MPMAVVIVRLSSFAALIGLCGFVELADAEDRFSVPGRVIVTSPEAFLQIAEEDPRPVPTATVLDYSRKNSPWLWVDAQWGWINQADVIPLSEAEAHYSAIVKKAEAAKQPAGVAHHQRGIARLALGQPQQALADFDTALKAGYGIANVDVNRGQALVQLDRTDDAIEAFTTAIAKAPDYGFAYHSRSTVLAAGDFLEAALSDADRAVELAPQNAVVWYGRGLLRQRDGQYKPAIGDYNQALKLSPRYVEAVANRGYCLNKIGAYDKSLADFQTAIEISPKMSVVQNDYAWLLATCPDESIRNAEAAIAAAKKAVKASKRKNGQYLDTLAAAYAAAGEWDDAIAVGTEASKLLEGADRFAVDQRLELYRNKKPYVATK